MSDGCEEREVSKTRIEEQKRENSQDQVERDVPDEGEPERGGS